MRRSTCSLAVVVILSVCFARVEADNDQSNYTFFGIMVGKMDFSRDAVAESAEPLQRLLLRRGRKGLHMTVHVAERHDVGIQ